MTVTELLQFAAALALVLALIGLSTVAARRFGLGGRRDAARRLGIVEVLPVDARRRLVLVRCDQHEHLLLLGPDGDRVVSARPHPTPPHWPLYRRSTGQDGAAP